jgi:hypothetical protein
MAIKRHSDYYTVVMEILRDEGPMNQKQLRERVAEKVNLTEEERLWAAAGFSDSGIG